MKSQEAMSMMKTMIRDTSAVESYQTIISHLQQVNKTLVRAMKLLEFAAGELAKIEELCERRKQDANSARND